MLAREVRILFRKEWRQLVRSRGAMLTALLLPIILLIAGAFTPLAAVPLGTAVAAALWWWGPRRSSPVIEAGVWSVAGVFGVAVLSGATASLVGEKAKAGARWARRFASGPPGVNPQKPPVPTRQKVIRASSDPQVGFRMVKWPRKGLHRP